LIQHHLSQLTRLRRLQYRDLLQKPIAHKLRKVTVAALAGTLLIMPNLSVAVLAQSAATAPQRNRQQSSIVLGVVRSTDNVSQWQQIVDRVQATGIPYREIDLQQVRHPSDLSGVSVLFLPNVETITSTQMIAIETWMNQGGRMIAAGPIGRRSLHGVRQAMRSLLGAYWEARLPQPGILQPVNREAQAWGISNLTTPITGGAIVPIGSESETVMTWATSASTPETPAAEEEQSSETTDRSERNSASSAVNPIPADTAAIVTTDQTTFLGWLWGDHNAQAFDRAWLEAAVNRFGQVPEVVVRPTQPTRSNLTPSRRQPPSVSAPTATAPSRSVRPAVPAPVSSTSQDPAEQVAPPGLQVERGALPITTMESIAMRQELENLIGRFESAVLTANSADANPDLAKVTPPESTPVSVRSNSAPILTASADDRLPSRVRRSATPDDVISEARQVLEAFPQLVARRDYATAREQWLRTRQLLWDNFPTDRPLAQTEVRAMWLDRGTIVAARSPQGLARVFDRMAEAGINTVFFETVNAGYTIYPSRVAPEQNPLTRGWDPLEAAVELAHERNMELHAWVWAFAAGNNVHNQIVNLPANYPGPVIAANPSWANMDNRGSIVPPGQGKPFLDPANPAVRSYLLRLFQEITTRYDVDGLQLDYIRYPFQDPGAGRTYGYGLAARQQFQQLTGVDPVQISPSDRQLWQQWTEFRSEQINSFVADTARVLRRDRPEIVLSVAVFAMSEHERLQKIQQHWEVWAQRGDIDLIVPMSYALDTNRLQRLAGPWVEETEDLGSVLVLPGIRLLNLPESAAFDQIQALRDMPAGGYSLFAAADLNDSLHTIFNRTQGDRTSAEDPIPYREPFAAAAARYTDLQREWSYLLENGQLWMRDRELEEWRTQAEALGESLDALADDPSQAQLRQTRQALSRFQQRFDGWMRLQSLNQNYRVRTWKNRLETLDVLLNYGERTVLERGDRTAGR
jgi:uncharacterized lipoprotein YddW (UPF0748 family)